MNILILGGTAFIGLEVTKKLIETGHNVSVFHRGKHSKNIPDGVNRIIGDRSNLSKFKDAFKKVKPDAVLDMVPFSDVTSKSVIDAIKDITNRLIAISSCDVYKSYGVINGTEEADPNLYNIAMNEKSPLRANYYPYKNNENLNHLKEYDKILAENVYIQNPNIEETILRLPMVFGENDYQHRLLPYLKQINEGNKTIELSKNFAYWRSCRAYVKDVAEAVCLAITKDKAKHQIYNVAEPNNYTEKDWLSKILKLINWNGEVIIKTSDDNSDNDEETLKQHLMIDSSKIRAELGYKENLPIEKQIKNTIRWEISHSDLKNISI